MTDTMHSAATLDHLTAAVHGDDRWVFLADNPEAAGLMIALCEHQRAAGKGGRVAAGEVEWVARDGRQRGRVAWMTAPKRDLPFGTIRTVFAKTGRPLPAQTDTNVMLLAADERAMRLFLAGLGHRAFAVSPVGLN